MGDAHPVGQPSQIPASRPGEDVKLRAAAVAVCRYRLRTGTEPIIMAVAAAVMTGVAVWGFYRRDFGTAVITAALAVELLALMPRLIRSHHQSQTRLQAFLAAAEQATATHRRPRRDTRPQSAG